MQALFNVAWLSFRVLIGLNKTFYECGGVLMIHGFIDFRLGMRNSLVLPDPRFYLQRRTLCAAFLAALQLK